MVLELELVLVEFIQPANKLLNLPPKGKRQLEREKVNLLLQMRECTSKEIRHIFPHEINITHVLKERTRQALFNEIKHLHQDLCLSLESRFVERICEDIKQILNDHDKVRLEKGGRDAGIRFGELVQEFKH